MLNASSMGRSVFLPYCRTTHSTISAFCSFWQHHLICPNFMQLLLKDAWFYQKLNYIYKNNVFKSHKFSKIVSLNCIFWNYKFRQTLRVYGWPRHFIRKLVLRIVKHLASLVCKLLTNILGRVGIRTRYFSFKVKWIKAILLSRFYLLY